MKSFILLLALSYALELTVREAPKEVKAGENFSLQVAVKDLPDRAFEIECLVPEPQAFLAGPTVLSSLSEVFHFKHLKIFKGGTYRVVCLTDGAEPAFSGEIIVRPSQTINQVKVYSSKQEVHSAEALRVFVELYDEFGYLMTDYQGLVSLQLHDGTYLENGGTFQVSEPEFEISGLKVRAPGTYFFVVEVESVEGYSEPVHVLEAETLPLNQTQEQGVYQEELASPEWSFFGFFGLETSNSRMLLKSVGQETQAAVLISDEVVFLQEKGGQYSIVLHTQPTHSVTVDLDSSGCSDFTVNPSTLTFSIDNYDVPHYIKLTATGNALQYSCTITHTVSSTDPDYDGVDPLPGSQITVKAISPCQAGMYSYNGKCEPCPQGYSCDMYSDKTACSGGEYSPLGYWNCIPCPPNHSCDGSGMPVMCSVGEIAAWGSTTCSTCSGKLCDPHGDTVTVPAGFYVLGDGHAIHPCPPGYKCAGGTNGPVKCSQGEYSAGGTSTCTTCPSGKQCYSFDLGQDLFCDPYSISDSTNTFCKLCPIGKECTTGSAVSCGTGTFSLEGWMECIDEDTYYPAFTMSKLPCPLGQYLSGTTCNTCTAGYECDGIRKKPCPPGFVSSAGASACTACALGEYSSQPTGTTCTSADDAQIVKEPNTGIWTCPRGTKPDADFKACISCTAGSQCDDPSTPTACAEGSFCSPIPLYKNSANTQTECPPGYFRTGTGADELSDCIACNPGKYCPRGSDVEKSCPKGHYCLERTAYGDTFTCPAGTFNSGNDKTDEASGCTECTAGKQCPEGSNIAEYPCHIGTYCLAGSSFPEFCDAGQTTTGKDQATNTCTACSEGHFCTPGSEEVKCPIGTYTDSTDLGFIWECSRCDAGEACDKLGMITSDKVDCAPGHVCLTGTEYPEQHPCPAGKESDSTGNTLFSDCSTDCPLGFYCPYGSTSTSKDRCPRGHYCLAGTKFSHQNACPAGTYLWEIGSDDSNDCTNCEVGKYCERGAEFISGRCAPGHYCPLNTERPTQHPCPAGKYTTLYNLTDSSECTACPEGAFCLEGSPTFTLCPKGTFNGSPEQSSCSPCTEGNYCPEGSITELQCPAKTYSKAGAYECYPCPAGYMCDAGTGDSAKTDCPAGYYCPEGTETSTKIECPKGNYCGPNSKEPTPCPAGTKRETAGATSSGECVNSSSGKYTILGSYSDIGECSPGYYCPPGSHGPFMNPCPGGEYRRETAGASSGDCSACPAGSYCPLGTAEPIICPVGYYCTAGISEPIFCPKGRLGRELGLTQESECTNCSEGSYCSQPGLMVADGYCTSGYQCSEGSTSGTPASSDCSAGGYCEPGFPGKRDCPPGSYNPDTGAKDSSWCRPCTAGKFCKGDEANISANECEAGYYCPVGSYWGKQNIADPGTYTTAGQSTELLCQAPKFNRLYAQASCHDCPEGFYCDEKQLEEPKPCTEGSYCEADVQIPEDCPIGTFGSRKGLTQESDCQDCTPGYYCSEKGLTTESGKCDPGYWCKTKGTLKKPDATTSDQGSCEAGYYCLQGTPIQLPCPSGSFNPDTLSELKTACGDCTQGKYCTSTGLSAVEGDCDGGFYCFAGTRVPRPNENGSEKHYCAKGQKCPVGSYEATDCPPGTYQDLDRQTDCNACPKGYFCPTGTSDYTANICPVGHYCPEGTKFSNEYPCPEGTYNSREGITEQSECVQCTPGKYCQGTGNSAPTNDCDGGYFCKIGSKTKNPGTALPGDARGGKCVAGYYCPSGIAYAKECDGGYYCDSDALDSPTDKCSAGYYCIGKSSDASPTDGVTGNVCPVGHYCLEGSISPIACPKGSYLSSEGNDEPEDCIQCPQGKYCGDAGLSAISGDCAPGFYCVAGSYELMPASGGCTKGHYCPEGSSEEKDCPPGTYQDQTLQSSCKTCPRGYYCPNAATETPTLCDAGYYCPTGTSNKIDCSEGTYNPLQGRWESTQCISCPPGKYCEGTANTAPDGDCNGGYYCTQGAVKADPDNSAQGAVCPKGHFCPAGSVEPVKCTPGKYCETTGLAAVTGNCDEGYYCKEGASTKRPRDGLTGDICPSGYYCEEGSEMPTPCAPGTYQGAQGKAKLSDCADCPAGFYCKDRAGTSVTSVCAAGYYCETGEVTDKPLTKICRAGYYCPSNSASEKECPAGKYQDQIGQDSCKNCPPGFYCDTNTVTPTLCPAGYKCPEGSSSGTKVKCQNGEYQPFTGQSSCLECPYGYYCGPGAITTPVVCPAEKYCETGTSQPATNCPPGTYTDKTGLQDKKHCMACPPGKYCQNGSIQGDCKAGFYCESGSNTDSPDSFTNLGFGEPCPEGHYCLEGTLLPTPCPLGKFRTSKGGASASDCSDCEAGFYCIPNDPVPKACPAGAYCPAGSSEPVECPRGTYSPNEKAKSSSSCVTCPAGHICDNEGIGNVTNYPCRPGFYCPAGSLTPVDSPRGYYSPGHQAGKIPELQVCPAGYFCLSKSTGYTPCDVGTYCPSGTYEPIACEKGKFCDNLSPSGKICPAGYYCPGYSPEDTDTLPFKCDEGFICPEGSSQQQSCEPGTVAEKARRVGQNIVPVCEDCPPGQYATSDNIYCDTCSPGYICLGKSTTPTPTSIEEERGYACSAGYYCQAGSYEETPCPAGTYSDTSIAGSQNTCTPCPAGTYSDLAASTSCKTCPSGATSEEGAKSCFCEGQNRLYLKREEICICQQGYEYIDRDGNDRSDSNGSGDCTEKIYERCEPGQVRDEFGNCKSDNDCEDTCGGSGKRSQGIGLCECDEVEEVNEVCDQSCRNSVPQVTFGANAGFKIYDPVSGNTTYMSESSMEGYYGRVACNSGTSCKVKSVEFGDGEVRGLYGTTSAMQNQTGRRLQESTPSIRNPVICIDAGDTMVFSVTQDHYPVYMKDSLVNTNSAFDYSEFDYLKTLVTEQSISTFGYTFEEPGIYLFGDSSNQNKQMMLGVMGNDETCPNADEPIQPRTGASMHVLGTKLDENLVLKIDWEVVIGLMLILVVAILILTALSYYYGKLTWDLPSKKKVPYRKRNHKMRIEGDEGTRTTMQLVIEGKEIDNSGSDADEVKEMLFHDKPDVATLEPTENLDENNQIDNTLISSIKERIRSNNRVVEEFLDKNSNEIQDRLKSLQQETEELSNVLYELLEPLESNPGKTRRRPTSSFNQLDTSTLTVAGTVDSDYQEAIKEIEENSELLEQDKQKLMSELQNQLQSLENNLSQDKYQNSEHLKERLNKRSQQRRQLAQEKQKLQEEAKSMNKRHQNERRQLEKDLEDQENQLEQEFNQEKQQVREQVFGQKARELHEQMQNKIAADPEESRKYLAEYEEQVKNLESSLSINQMKMHQDLLKKLEERKKQRQAQSQTSKKQQIDNLTNKQELEKKNIQTRQHEIVTLEAVNSAVKGLYDSEEDSEIKELEQKHKAQLIEVETQLKEPEIPAATPKANKQKVNLEKKREQLLQTIEKADPQEKEQLMTMLKDTETKLQKFTEQQTQDQKKDLEQRLESRRQKRHEKIQAIKKQQEEERNNLELQKKLHHSQNNSQKLEKAIKEAISNIPEDQQLSAVKQLLEAKHEKERYKLQEKLKKKLAKKQKQVIQDVLRRKAHDLEMVRKEFKQKSRAAGKDQAAIAQIQKEESEALNKLDYHYIKECESEQEQAWKNQQQLNQQELLDLVDSQLAEMRRYLNQPDQDLVAHDYENKLKQEKQTIEEEGKKKLEELENKKSQLKHQREAQQRELEDMIAKERSREERIQKKKQLMEQKKALQEKQRRQREELEKRGNISKEQMEQLIAQHQKELSELESVIARERERQMSVLNHKLAEKRNRKKEFESSVMRMKEEQEKWEKEIEELPGIKNKQATTLLLKWRRYPKRSMKEVEKSVKNKEPHERTLPVMATQEQPTLQEDSRIQEVIRRVRKIEEVVANIDVKQFDGLVNALNGLERSLKSNK